MDLPILIATLGTACTQDHLKSLSRYAQRLYLLYDGDAAGQNAILRVAELCWQVAIDPFVVTLPGSDPASFLVSGGDLQKQYRSCAGYLHLCAPSYGGRLCL